MWLDFKGAPSNRASLLQSFNHFKSLLAFFSLASDSFILPELLVLIHTKWPTETIILAMKSSFFLLHTKSFLPIPSPAVMFPQEKCPYLLSHQIDGIIFMRRYRWDRSGNIITGVTELRCCPKQNFVGTMKTSVQTAGSLTALTVSIDI